MARKRLTALKPSADWHEFASREALAVALAAEIRTALAAAMASRGVGFLAVSGGTTPGSLFAELSTAALDWPRVVVTLVDERFVPENSPRSNAALVRDALLRGPAAAARFEGLFRAAGSVEAAAAQAEAALGALAWPLDAAILGMGADGHTASFFADAADRAAPLDPSSQQILLPVHAKSAGEPRLTLVLARLVEAGFLALHIEGDAKKRLLVEALEAEASALPIRAVFDNARRPVRVFWAP